MTRQTLFSILFLILSFSTFGQVKFEKGYFIDNNGVKTECFIKNKGWRSNPEAFEYKLAIASEVKIRTIKTVSEFYIAPDIKYKKFKVAIDQSNQNIKFLGKNKEPEFITKTVLLKYIVQGKATLLLYEGDNHRLYFYTVDEKEMTQLVYKSYKVSANQVAKNRKYRQQLWSDLRCDGITMDALQNLRYNRKDLVRYINLYNTTCGDATATVDYTKKENKKFLKLSVRPGVRFTSLSTKDIREGLSADFDDKIGVRLGAEVEFVLPFNKNKWSVIVEPTFQSYSNNQEVVVFESETLGVRSTANLEVDYKSIELPIGIRHSFYLNNNSRIYINGAFVLDFSLNSKVTAQEISFEGRPLDLEISSSPTFAFGLGYTYKNKYTLEARHIVNRDILSSFTLINTDYSVTSIIFGYTLF